MRAALRERILSWLGTPTNLDPDYRVVSIREGRRLPHPCGTLTRIAYEVEPGETVRAYLLVPHGVTRPAPAVLCLHETVAEAKESVLWADPEQPNRDWATQLCKEGFITFSPDLISAGERVCAGFSAFDISPFYERHPNWSEMGKIAWDTRCALDALELCNVADMTRIGAVGHSLGGYASIQSAAFDERIKAVVSSCGFAVWENNEKRFEWARQGDFFRHFPALYEPFLRGEVPFELYELAALIAPRAFLNLSGMEDATYGHESNAALPEAGRRLAELWSQAGAPEGFANFLFGASHDVTDYCSPLVAGWFRHWLLSEAGTL